MFFKRAKQNKKKKDETEAEAKNGAAVSGEAAQSQLSVDPKSLGFETTAEIDPAEGVVGQARALEQVVFGAGMKGPGYNMLLKGSADAGWQAAARAKLEGFAAKAETPSDWVYVSYFDTDGGYRALKLAPGAAQSFAAGMAQVIDRLADALSTAFAADDYEIKRRTIEEEFRFSREDALQALRREAEAQNIALLRTPAGIAVAPILEGKVVKSDVFGSVPEQLQREVQTKIAALEAEIEQVLAERPGAEKARRERLTALNEQVAGAQVRAVLDDLAGIFPEVPGMERYLKAAGRDLVRNAGLFLARPGDERVPVPVGTIGDMRFARYRVHVMAGSTEGEGAPIVEETNPTYANLFGRIEVAAAGEGQAAQVARIKPGALHRANGGFLILEARALVAEPNIIEALVRALETEEIRFDPPADPVGIVNGEIPDLEPIPLSVKLVVYGDADALREFSQRTPRFKRLFKVEAEFDETVERSPETVAAYARVIAGIVKRNALKPVEAGGVAMLIEEAARKAGGNGKLSLEIEHVADICREADHWSGDAGRHITSTADVERVLKDRGPPAEARESDGGSA
jgi:LonB-like, AAA domain/Archaeal LonB, AAA+ ATPase LID domain